jgi:hypothetical protein
MVADRAAIPLFIARIASHVVEVCRRRFRAEIGLNCRPVLGPTDWLSLRLLSRRANGFLQQFYFFCGIVRSNQLEGSVITNHPIVPI